MVTFILCKFHINGKKQKNFRGPLQGGICPTSPGIRLGPLCRLEDILHRWGCDTHPGLHRDEDSRPCSPEGNSHRLSVEKLTLFASFSPPPTHNPSSVKQAP